MTSIVSQGENRWRGNKTTFVIVYFKACSSKRDASCSNNITASTVGKATFDRESMASGFIFQSPFHKHL